MADKPKTKWGEYNGQLYYARIFKDNMDDSDYHDKTQGQFNVVFVPDEDEKVIEISNSTAFGLSSGVCTNNFIRAKNYLLLGSNLKLL